MTIDADMETDEIQALENEFQWVLRHEVPQVLLDLNLVIKEAISKFPMSLGGSQKSRETETFVLNTPSTTPTDQVRVLVALTGDSITHSDINLKLPRQIGTGPGTGSSAGKDLYQNTSIRDDAPWMLQQIQDAANHLQVAAEQVRHVVTEMGMDAENEEEEIDAENIFRSAQEVTSFIARVMGSLQRTRAALANPKKRTLEDLKNSKYAKRLVPPLSPELAVSFYLQNGKLMFAVYHVVVDPKSGGSKFNRYQADCIVPWINDAIYLLSMAMQKGQELIDKVNIFSQYSDFPSQPHD